jgi:superfamily II DNA helicase RecQ
LAFICKGDKKETTVRDAQDYCLGLKCRHQILASAFGEEIEPCLVNCDFCVNPQSVSEAIEAASSHKKETADNWRSSRKKLLKRIDKAATSSNRNSSQDSLEGSRRSSPVKKILKFDIKKKTMAYVEETGKRKLYTIICYTNFMFRPSIWLCPCQFRGRRE